MVVPCTSVGHNESVLSACWNHNGTCLMSCSKDKTVRLWSMAAKDPLLCLDKMLHNFKGSETSEPNVKVILKYLCSYYTLVLIC